MLEPVQLRQSLNKVCERDRQPVSEPPRERDAHFTLTPFDEADLRSVHFGGLSQLLLRQPSCLSKFTDTVAEGEDSFSVLVLSAWHLLTVLSDY